MNTCFWGDTPHPAPKGRSTCDACLAIFAQSDKARKIIRDNMALFSDAVRLCKTSPSKYDLCGCGEIKWNGALRCRECSDKHEFKPCSAILRDGSKCEYRSRGGGHCSRCTEALLRHGKPRIPTGSYRYGKPARDAEAKAALRSLAAKIKPRTNLEAT